MMTDLAPPQIRGMTGLELAAGVFAKCSDQLATQLKITLTSGAKDTGPLPFSIGINGDVYGGMRAPLGGRHAPRRYRLRQSVSDGSDGLPRQGLLQTKDGAAGVGLLSRPGTASRWWCRRIWA